MLTDMVTSLSNPIRRPNVQNSKEIHTPKAEAETS